MPMPRAWRTRHFQLKRSGRWHTAHAGILFRCTMPTDAPGRLRRIACVGSRRMRRSTRLSNEHAASAYALHQLHANSVTRRASVRCDALPRAGKRTGGNGASLKHARAWRNFWCRGMERKASLFPRIPSFRHWTSATSRRSGLGVSRCSRKDVVSTRRRRGTARRQNQLRSHQPIRRTMKQRSRRCAMPNSARSKSELRRSVL